MDHQWLHKQLKKMTMHKRRRVYTILIALLVFGLIGGLYAYKEYNRKNVDLTSATPAFVLAGTDLIRQFADNAINSNKKYLGKIIELNGEVKKVDTDAKGFHTIVIGNPADMNSVRCSMDSSTNKSADNLKIGETLKIRGICTGYNADDLGLGSDVILNRCIISKK